MMTNNEISATKRYFIEETLDLILTRDNIRIKDTDYINLYLNSLEKIETFISPNFLLGGLKGLHIIIDLYHRKGFYYIKTLCNYLEFERRKEHSYSSDLRGKKIDKKFLINCVNRGMDISQLEEFRTIRKVKYYDKFYNLFFIIALMDILKSLHNSLELMEKDYIVHENIDIEKIPLYIEIKKYYIILTRIMDNNIIQEIISKNKTIIYETESKNQIKEKMNSNYRALPKEYKMFFNWYKDFYYKDKFIDHKNFTEDRLFEYYTIKYLSTIFNEDLFIIEQNPIYKNSNMPIYRMKNENNIINIYYQNTMPLKMPRMLIEHDNNLNSLGNEMILIPDIIMEFKNRTDNSYRYVILDSKYRTNFNSSDDRYKMLGYLYNLGENNIPLILVYYDFEKDNPMKPKVYKYKDTDNGYLVSLKIGNKFSNNLSYDLLLKIIREFIEPTF